MNKEKDYEIQDDDRVFVTLQSGETIERTWGKSATTELEISDVDPSIRKLVRYYNQVGIKTKGSCAGHKDNGFISFNRYENKERIREIARSHGITRARFRNDGHTLYLVFSPQERYRRVRVVKTH